MKIILKEDHISLGSVGDVVTVADGYARNFLVPKGIALEATRGNLRQLDAMKDALMKRRAKQKSAAEEFAESLSALDLTFERKAGEEDRLFGSVTAADIAAAIGAHGFEIDKRALSLDEHIKSLGESTVHLKLHPEVTADLTVKVLKEGGEEEAVEEEASAEEEADLPEEASAEAPDSEPAEDESAGEPEVEEDPAS